MSLLEGLLGGVDWRDIVHPIREHISWLLAMLLVLYIVFCILAILNVITGSFVQSAMTKASDIKDEHCLNQARKLFICLDSDQSGGIQFNELLEHLAEPVVQEFFETLDIDVSEAKSLFELIDLDNSGVIDFDEFLGGCMRLHGPAKATDLLLVTRDTRAAFERQAMAFMALEQHMCSIMDALLPPDIPSPPRRVDSSPPRACQVSGRRTVKEYSPVQALEPSGRPLSGTARIPPNHGPSAPVSSSLHSSSLPGALREPVREPDGRQPELEIDVSSVGREGEQLAHDTS